MLCCVAPLPSDEESITSKKSARTLEAAERTVYTMAQELEPPAIKVRGRRRFRCEDIDRWIDHQQSEGVEEGSDE